MMLEELLSLAAAETPTPLENARARRALRRVQDDLRRRLTEGHDIISDVDLRDPLRDDDDDDEAARIGRAAELRKHGSVTWDATERRLSWSVEMSRIFGLAPSEADAVTSLRALFGMVHPHDRRAVRRRVHAAWRTRSAVGLVCRILKHDGTAGYVEFLVEVVTDRAGRATGLFASAQDVTPSQRRRQDDERRALRAGSVQVDLAETDAVTGLLSRRAFLDELGRLLRSGTGTLLVVSAPPYIRRSAVAGPGEDERLSAAAAAVFREFADPKCCGLLGRHEFGLIMPWTTPATAVEIADRVVDALRDTSFLVPGTVGGGNRFDAHGGLVRYDYRVPVHGIDLIVDAETAWRRAKHEGEQVHVLQPPSTEERRESCRAGVRHAVDEGRFALYAQPLRDLELNLTTRHEILLRVLDDVGRPVPPTSFLDLAEHVDETLAVDKWVIDNALKLIGQGPQTAHYQLNISGRSLADVQLLKHLRAAVDKFGVDPECLTIEITETAAIGNLTVARRFADGIRELGCQLALDDFGTGNTPLGFLTKLPVDLVKIDGSFVRGLADSEAMQAVVEGLARMCRRLGILTAAEYVEDAATLALLREYGVDFAQGYYVGAPEQLVTRPPRTESIELALSPTTTRSNSV